MKPDKAPAGRKAPVSQWGNLLLTCGIIASLLYIAMNIIIPMFYPGYNPVSRVVSELSAIGAPTRTIWVVPAVESVKLDMIKIEMLLLHISSAYWYLPV